MNVKIAYRSTLYFQTRKHHTHGGTSVNSQPILKLFFTVRFATKFAAKYLLKIPLHLTRRYATLLNINVSKWATVAS